MQITIAGKTYKWKIDPNMVYEDNRPRSKLHLAARSIIREVYPYDRLLEEVPIPKLKLYIDFLLPLRKLVIEVNGEQHYVYKPYFYESKLDFLKAQKRDREKTRVLEENGFEIITFRYDEKDKWKQQLEQQKGI